MVYQIKDVQDFDSKMTDAGSKLVVVDFFATWCGPCRNIAPELDNLAKEYSETAVVIKVDIDEIVELPEKYNIQSLPTFVFFRNGEVLEELVGANVQKLKALFAKHTV